MGNREALIEGAKSCLMEKGYSRTTARDIATAAGVSLAAIGYHFGSKEALMNEAMRQALDSWGADVAKAMSADQSTEGDVRERFAATWSQAVKTLESPATRALWVTQYEVLSLGAHIPELLEALSKLQGEAREGLAQLFGSADESTDQETVQQLGGFYQALMLGVIALWLFDPEKAPKGDDLAKAIQLVATQLGS
ncbi:TetR/AcrR family transcriptional regulator [Streptomyces sp. SID13031]|uniref:TetR/AcrR family transcriptional regulator n=1 Tax=Streptomyces sp. SID13031 TaxID=2706046 RepID=UPI0013C7F078|nr:TetR/AcrR family transcriptional regulator [Streptomyces sp. SID13031]NEA36468.1 TetR/AcrR family transcriptional regulator [Streptomyces sp. SID13031]